MIRSFTLIPLLLSFLSFAPCAGNYILVCLTLTIFLFPLNFKGFAHSFAAAIINQLEGIHLLVDSKWSLQDFHCSRGFFDLVLVVMRMKMEFSSSSLVYLFARKWSLIFSTTIKWWFLTIHGRGIRREVEQIGTWVIFISQPNTVLDVFYRGPWERVRVKNLFD